MGPAVVGSPDRRSQIRFGGFRYAVCLEGGQSPKFIHLFANSFLNT